MRIDINILHIVQALTQYQNIISRMKQTTRIYITCVTFLISGDRGSTVVKVLCYKSEGRWFDPS